MDEKIYVILKVMLDFAFEVWFSINELLLKTSLLETKKSKTTIDQNPFIDQKIQV